MLGSARFFSLGGGGGKGEEGAGPQLIAEPHIGWFGSGWGEQVGWGGHEESQGHYPCVVLPSPW